MDMAILQLIADYEPSEDVRALVDSTNIVLLCGITGAGKDTVKAELLKSVTAERIITSTTRAPRENDGVMEQDGREYYFFTTEQAIDNIKQQRYFEVAAVHGRINGVTAQEIIRLKQSNATAIGDVDYQGVDYFKKYAPSTLAIFLIPPTFDEWIRRLRRRYDSEEAFEAAWPERRSSSIRELEWALATPDCEVVVNDELDTTVRQAQAIISGELSQLSDGRRVAVDMLNQLRGAAT